MKARWPIVVLAGCLGLSLGWLQGAETVAPTATASAAKTVVQVRSFAQPVRENPVGKMDPKQRAFLGAPPPNPHAFTGERDGPQCLSCHAHENRIEKRQQAIAPVAHPEFTSCQQCHVNGSTREESLFRENEFVGLADPGKGSRAHPLAPPTVPHKTFMRERCLSCHGPGGKQRVATRHPERSQCQQCHVPDATKNYDRPVPWTELDGTY